MTLRLGLMRLGLALLLQPVLLELLRIERLLRIALLLVLLLAFATLRTIAPVGTASSAAAAATSRAARLFAILLRLTVAVWRARVGSLLRGSLRRALLLRRTRRTLIGAPLALRTPGGLAFGLRRLALLLGFALGPIRPCLLRLRRALVAARLALAAWLIAPAFAALLVIAALMIPFPVTIAARLAIAPAAAFAAAMIVPVA